MVISKDLRILPRRATCRFDIGWWTAPRALHVTISEVLGLGLSYRSQDDDDENTIVAVDDFFGWPRSPRCDVHYRHWMHLASPESLEKVGTGPWTGKGHDVQHARTSMSRGTSKMCPKTAPSVVGTERV